MLQRLESAVDAASIGLYRVAFGLLMFAGVIRFWLNGWIEALYIQPSMHFTYYGFAWVRPLPPAGMYAVFAAMAVAALLVAAGVYYRVAMAAFFLLFTYVELIDAANYLNHYYLVSLIAFLGIFLPLDRAFTLKRRDGPAEVPGWVLWTLRAQVGLVYFFAGVAKLDAEWLFDAQPLTIWFAANSDLPVIGPMLAWSWVPYVASWGAAFFDLTIVGWLLWRRSRPYAFAVVVVFHVLTIAMFNLGLFPWLMMVNATLFFAPSWPRRVKPPVRRDTRSRVPVTLLGVYFAVQVLMPLRHHLYPGDAGRTEEASRFAWRVMLKEKAGFVVFHVTDDTGRRWEAYPRDYLSEIQTKMFATEPDMIRQLARHIRDDFTARGLTGVEVRAEAYVSTHGRPSAPLVDPNTDLAAARDGLSPRDWILR